MTTYKIFKIICEKSNNHYIYFTKEHYLSNVLSSFKKKVKKETNKYNGLFINPTIHIIEYKKNIEDIEEIKEYIQEIINKTECVNNPNYKQENKQPIKTDEAIIKKKEEVKIEKFNKIMKQQKEYRNKKENKDKKREYDRQRNLKKKEKKQNNNT